MRPAALRKKTFEDLHNLGFTPANSLPLPDAAPKLRPVREIASRLIALDALFTWVAFSTEQASTARIKKYAKVNEVEQWLAPEELTIFNKSRTVAHKVHVNTIGWRLENMWALAWVLGFEPEPPLEAAMIPDEVTREMLLTFLPGLDATVDDLLAKAKPRSDADVAAMEYRFYCAHNAVRSAQMGEDTVPNGFHPILHGGTVHERRHSYTWCLSPDHDWDDTDLST